jgi:DNA-binding GntR family transcriptional regulator
MSTPVGTRLARLRKVPSLKERAYATIKEHILQDLSSEDPLSVDALASQLGISRTPVREALITLEFEGLVYSVPNKGTFVAGPSVEEMLSIYQVRAALEGLAIRLATPNIDEDELQQLVTAFDAAEDPIEEGDFEPYFSSDVDFHHTIREYAGNPVLSRMLANLEDRLHRIRAYARRRSREHLISSFHEHQEVLNALLERDPDKAEQVMKEHLNRAAHRIERIMRGEATGA